MPVLAHQNLVKIIRGVSPMIFGDQAITDDQIQMASVDLSLGSRAYGMRAAALPRDRVCVQEMIDSLTKYSFELNENEDKLLHRNQTYIIPLNERLKLPKGFSAKFSPKSSIGRIDVFVRVLADGIPHFDHIHENYQGPLYLEVTPLSCDILVRARQTLVQMRIKHGESRITDKNLSVRQSGEGIVWGKDGKPIPSYMLKTAEHGVYMHVDLDREIIGFVARDPMMAEIALANKDFYNPEDCWEPIRRPKDLSLTLIPGRFYLLATKERIKIPTDVCGDIAPYDASAGEYRSHYAGFFDPGFGGTAEKDAGTVGVMEIRGREMPFRLEDNQPICRMDFEQMDEVPDVLYGAKSHYTGSGASLSKFFKNRQEIWTE